MRCSLDICFEADIVYKIYLPLSFCICCFLSLSLSLSLSQCHVFVIHCAHSINQGANSEDTDIVFKILSQLHTAVGSEEDISDQDQVCDHT